MLVSVDYKRIWYVMSIRLYNSRFHLLYALTYRDTCPSRDQNTLQHSGRHQLPEMWNKVRYVAMGTFFGPIDCNTVHNFVTLPWEHSLAQLTVTQSTISSSDISHETLDWDTESNSAKDHRSIIQMIWGHHPNFYPATPTPPLSSP